MYLPLVYFLVYASIKVSLWLRPRIVLVKDKLCGNNNTNPLDVADLLNSREFSARMEDDGDNYSTSSESTSESLVPDDGGEQQQEQQHNQCACDNDVEMIHSVDWNNSTS